MEIKGRTIPEGSHVRIHHKDKGNLLVMALLKEMVKNRNIMVYSCTHPWAKQGEIRSSPVPPLQRDLLFQDVLNEKISRRNKA